MPATTPANPAPVSGPGALSKRTDSGPAQKLRDLPDAQYGEASTYRNEQRAAPLSQTPATPTPGAGAVAGPALPTPFHAPTQDPEEPVTAGAPLGPGPGLEAIGGTGGGYQTALDLLRGAAASSNSPEVRYLADLFQTGT